MTKNITLIGPHYEPETTAPAKRAVATSRFLQQHGWNVTVVTLAPNYPVEKVYDGYGHKWIDTRVENDIKVVRIRPWIAKKGNLIMRFLSEAYFSFVALCYILFRRKDVVYATCPFMLIGPITFWASLWPGVAFVQEYRDLTWRYFGTTGKRTFGAAGFLKQLMLWTARRADCVITTTQGQLDYFVERNSVRGKGLVIPSGISEDLISALDEPAPETSETAHQEFRVTYAGLLGFAQGTSTILHAARLVPEATFYLVGDGADYKLLESLIAEHDVRNVQLPGYVTFQEVVEHYRNADILVACLRNDPVFEVTQPSKVWEYMAAGKPIVYSGAGEAARAITDSQAGLTVPPEDSTALANAIQQLRENAQLRNECGLNGRRFVHENMRRETLLPRLDQALTSLI